MDRKYSFGIQIKNDYLALIGLIFFICFYIVSIGLLIFKIGLTKANDIILDNKVNNEMGYIFGLFSLFWLIWFIVRIILGKYFVKNGIEIDAEVCKIIYNWRGYYGRIEYKYKMNGKHYCRSNAFYKTKITEKYEKGNCIKILVCPKNNKSAIIMDFLIRNI